MMNVFELLERNDTTAIRKLISKGEDPNVMNSDTGESLLAAAIARRDSQLVKSLLRAGADPNFRQTVVLPLDLAAGRGLEEIVAMLLAAGANTETKNEEGGTALMSAAAGGHLKAVKLLLHAGANAKAKDRYGKSAIVYGAEKNHREIVEMLMPTSTRVMHARADLILRLHEQGPPTEEMRDFISAAYVGALGVVREYVGEGMDVNILAGEGQSVLMEAAIGGRLKVVKYLIDQGADVNYVNPAGESALTYAALGGHSATYEFLYPLTDKKLRRRAEGIKEAMIQRKQWKLPEEWE